MKYFYCLFLAALLVSTSLRAEEAQTIPVVTPQEASAQEGKEVTVKGVVDSQKNTPKGITYLNFGGHYPNQLFSCLIRSRDIPDMIPNYEGIEVEVTGLIKMYQGKPSMDIKSIDKIHMVEGVAEGGAGGKTEAAPTSNADSKSSDTEH